MKLLINRATVYVPFVSDGKRTEIKVVWKRWTTERKTADASARRVWYKKRLLRWIVIRDLQWVRHEVGYSDFMSNIVLSEWRNLSQQSSRQKKLTDAANNSCSLMNQCAFNRSDWSTILASLPSRLIHTPKLPRIARDVVTGAGEALC